LTNPVANLNQHHHEISAALDMIFSGFWTKSLIMVRRLKTDLHLRGDDDLG
jgi:hypothetical protein